jgi:hypothetical protein
VTAILGRTLTPDDDQPSATPVAVISYRYWQSRFGGTPGILGKIIQVNRVPVALIGVTPQGFAGAMQVGESVRLNIDQTTRPRNRRMIGRRVRQHQPEKLAQRERVGGPPRDRALRSKPSK